MKKAGVSGDGKFRRQRITNAFEKADLNSSYRFAEELLRVLRDAGEFSGVKSNYHPTQQLRASFSALGLKLDANGNPYWGGYSGVLAPRASATLMVSQLLADVGHLPVGAIRKTDKPEHGPSWNSSRTGDAPAVITVKSDAAPATVVAPRIFSVHGHDEAARNEVEVFINRTTGLTPVVLMLEPSGGRTVIEKFEEHADRSSYAVILMTDDDRGNDNAAASEDPPRLKSRPRQNVVFEFGYFVGTLRRSHVAALIRPGVEKPSDIAGLVYIEFAPGSDWREGLRREMKQAGLPIQ